MRVDQIWAERANKVWRQDSHEAGQDHEVGLEEVDVLEQHVGPSFAAGKAGWRNHKSWHAIELGVGKAIGGIVRANGNDSGAEQGVIGCI